MDLEFTDGQAKALTKGLHKLIDGDRFPLAPRLNPLKAILAKLEPPKPPPEPLRPAADGRNDDPPRQAALKNIVLAAVRSAYRV
jgi:hypothetical protein